jgi:hypothetical protein
MEWTRGNRRTWIVAGLMAALALGMAPGSARADKDRDHAQSRASPW